MGIIATNELKPSSETVEKLSPNALLIYENKNSQTAGHCSHLTTNDEAILISSSRRKCSGLYFGLVYFLSKIGIKIIPKMCLQFKITLKHLDNSRRLAPRGRSGS